MADELEKRVDEYANNLLTNEINSCQKIKWQCLRYFKFKKKYSFDNLELLKFYIWSSQFKYRTGTKGIKGCKIQLHNSLLFDAANILCFKKADGNRLTRKVYIQKARKNVKTMFMALISSYIAFNVNDEQQEIYIAGWDKEQSSICFREIDYQLSTSVKIKGKYKNSYGKITINKNGSFIKPLSREARNTGDGTNPSVGIVDEYHAHKTSELYDVIDTGMAARDNGLMIIITTPGFDLSRPCYKEYQYVSKILDPSISVENDSYYIAIYETEEHDDLNDENVWIKANPVVATYEGGIEYLKGKLDEMQTAPEKKRNVLTKNFGRWVDMRADGYLEMNKWDKAKVNIINTNTDKTSDFFSQFNNHNCVLGVDLSTKLDLTSIAFEFFKDGKYYICQHSWMPEETYLKRMNENKYRFDLWKDEKFLTICPGAVIDYGYITDYIHKIENEFNVKVQEIAYDPMNATHWVQEMEFEGYVCVEVRQGPFTLNEPTKDFRDKLYSNELYHCDDGLYTWTASNAIATQHKQEYIMLDKKVSAEKIDPMAASINAHYRATKILSYEDDIFYSPGKR